MNLTSLTLRRGVLVSVILALAFVLAACSGNDEGDGSPAASGGASGGTVTVENGNVDLTAENLEFSASVIEAPAGEEFTITFTNLESQPHNVAVDTEEGGDEIVTGDGDHRPRRGDRRSPCRRSSRASTTSCATSTRT